MPVLPVPVVTGGPYTCGTGAFAIIFRNPQSKARTEALIWPIASLLFKRCNPTCLAWSHMKSQFVTSDIFIRVLLSYPSITGPVFDGCDFVAEALTLILASEKTKASVAPSLPYLALLRCVDVPPQLFVDLACPNDMGKSGSRNLRACICIPPNIEVLSNHGHLIRDQSPEGPKPNTPRKFS